MPGMYTGSALDLVSVRAILLAVLLAGRAALPMALTRAMGACSSP